MKDPLWSAVLLFCDHTSSTFGFKLKFPGLFYPFLYLPHRETGYSHHILDIPKAAAISPLCPDEL
jgi:hypothetical protein